MSDIDDRIRHSVTPDGFHSLFVRLAPGGERPTGIETFEATGAHVDVDESGALAGITVFWRDQAAADSPPSS